MRLARQAGASGVAIDNVGFGERQQLPRLREKVRPIYVRMGILPEMAAGIGSASDLGVPPEEQ